MVVMNQQQMLGKHRAEILATQPWVEPSFDLPERLRQVPTMLTHEECRMLVWLTRNLFLGRGTICELGAFMGGSTVHLAYGLRGNRVHPAAKKGWMSPLKRFSQCRSGKPLHSFDAFYVPAEAKQGLLDYWGFPPFEGTDFFPVFQRNIEEFADLIAVNKGDIANTNWKLPIEILFVDCCKDWDTNDAVTRKFYPFLIPGVSVIVQQDYLHFQHPWVVATMEALYPLIRPVAYTAENSMIFACYNAVTRQDVDAVAGLRGDLGRVKELVRRAQMRFNDPTVKHYIGEHLVALEKNPEAIFSWDFHL